MTSVAKIFSSREKQVNHGNAVSKPENKKKRCLNEEREVFIFPKKFALIFLPPPSTKKTFIRPDRKKNHTSNFDQIQRDGTFRVKRSTIENFRDGEKCKKPNKMVANVVKIVENFIKIIYNIVRTFKNS